ncbi:MAG: sulfurtransferase TusA family protein [Sphingomonadaceae bacterium]|nr:sulfurtransferase TusA family protein [Sphingomonadaceae bacterium]
MSGDQPPVPDAAPAAVPGAVPEAVPEAVVLDARGWRCPWPVVRLARALRDGAGAVDLLADDPAAEGEVAAFAAARGLTLAAIPGGWRVMAIEPPPA